MILLAAKRQKHRGSTPLKRTLQKSPIMGMKECYVKTQKVFRRVQAGAIRTFSQLSDKRIRITQITYNRVRVHWEVSKKSPAQRSGLFV